MTSSIAMILSRDSDLYSGFLSEHQMHGRFFDSVSGLNRALVQDHDLEVLLLDVRMVMEAKPEERDRLFALSRDLPVIRTHSCDGGKTLNMLDSFQFEKRDGVRRAVRGEDRKRVRLDAMISDYRDPFLAKPQEAVVLDLSPGGCFVHVPNNPPKEDYLYLKLLGPGPRLPIHCAVRWRRAKAGGGLPSGLGLKFMDIAQDQCTEIMSQTQGEK